MLVESIHRRPLVLVGNGWRSVFDQLFSELGIYISEQQREQAQFAETIETAVKIINNFEYRGNNG
jgi:hypothetical protein